MADAHSRRSANFKDLTGLRFTRLTVTEFAGVRRHALWRCRCDCGAEKIVESRALRSGTTKSCGCWIREVVATRIAASSHVHGAASKETQAAYSRWKLMMRRCYSEHEPTFVNYGGRGITVCERWHNPRNFVDDMGNPPPGMTLDRIDNDGPYSPENCRWSTRKEQSANRRNTAMLTVGGRTRPVYDWAAEAGVNPITVLNRMRRGWPPELVLRPAAARGEYVVARRK